MFGQNGAVFGSALEFYHDQYQIKVLTSDMAYGAGLSRYKQKYLNDFYDVGIAEQNLMGITAGLASEGFKCVATAQACFLSMRSFEQMRQYAGYMKFPIIFIGINAGLSLTYMGNTHFSVEDLGLARSIPGMTVFSPCDAGEAAKAFEAALNLEGPSYIRLMGSLGAQMVHQDDFNLEVGQPLELRSGEDIQILATGNMVSVALGVANELANEGISAQLLDVHTIKPFDASCLSEKAKLIVTIEEHTLVNGLGSLVAGILATRKNHPILLPIGLEDGYGKVGEYNWMLEGRGLTVENIVKQIKNTL
jgi:transketolase